ncbi:MAG TPA: hypothetical protein VH186_13665 [Chloroflexia bacterium]|nr:hypothetical protein [Chloroflexia bacterium]
MFVKKGRFAGLLILIAGILTLLLGACEDQQASTPTAPATARPETTPPPTAKAGLVSYTAQPALTLPPTLTPSATLSPAEQSMREQALQAVRKLATATPTFRYSLQQTGELKSGASTNQFEASGGGEWQNNSFHQLVNLKLDGQTTQVENYGQSGTQLYQQIVALDTWRKLQPPVKGPFPSPELISQAVNFQAAGKETLNGQNSTKISWQLPSVTLLPSNEQAEGLGALSATGLYQSFLSDNNSLAQATLWIDSASNLPLRYDVQAAYISGDNALKYTASYTYSQFNDSLIKVKLPAILPG